MTEDDDIDGLAAEYVLGALDAAERRVVNDRRLTDASLAQAISEWERRLGPLSAWGGDVTPPAGVFDRILERISGSAAQSAGAAEVVPLRRSSGRRWAFAAATSALAACLMLAVVGFNYLQPPAQVDGKMDCGKLYMDFWRNRNPQSYARTSPEQLAGISRMVLRAYDACQAGDELDARALLARLHERNSARTGVRT